MASDRVELHAIVRGRVQGVSFRVRVQQLAKSMGLHGTVANLADGTVEVVVQGAREQVDSFIAKLKQMPTPVHVEEVALQYRNPQTLFTSFQIIVPD